MVSGSVRQGGRGHLTESLEAQSLADLAKWFAEGKRRSTPLPGGIEMPNRPPKKEPADE